MTGDEGESSKEEIAPETRAAIKKMVTRCVWEGIRRVHLADNREPLRLFPLRQIGDNSAPADPRANEAWKDLDTLSTVQGFRRLAAQLNWRVDVLQKEVDEVLQGAWPEHLAEQVVVDEAKEGTRYVWPEIHGDLVILQTEKRGTSRIDGSCLSGRLPGLAAPARIAVVPLDSDADQPARDLVQQLKSRLGISGKACAPPQCRLLDCATMRQSQFMNTLVLVVSAPIDRKIEGLANEWLGRAPDQPRVLLFLRNIDYSKAIPDPSEFPLLSLYTFANWTTSDHVASLVVEQALTRERPQVLISYVRSEASTVADQLHDELSRRGYRVFLDRFAGTPGRLFPEQIAEEMAEMGVVIALETPELMKKRWTRWEMAFARLYGMGILALNFKGAPVVPGVVARHSVSAAASDALPAAPLEKALGMILRSQLQASLRRQAMYRAIVAEAAARGGGSVQAGPYGAQLLKSKSGISQGIVLAAGRPGRLHDIYLLELQRKAGLEAILAGQHAHLPAEARKDVAWLASERAIVLSGRSDIYRRVRQLAGR
jgi:hypothetical protein